jgi:hypothetical protein
VDSAAVVGELYGDIRWPIPSPTITDDCIERIGVDNLIQGLFEIHGLPTFMFGDCFDYRSRWRDLRTSFRIYFHVTHTRGGRRYTEK